MMLVYDNGKYRDMTQAEEIIYKEKSATMPQPAPTAEERLAALESAMLVMMGGGVNGN